MKFTVVAFVLITCLLVPICIGASPADAPSVTVEVLRQTKDWTPNKVKNMISYVARIYDYDEKELLWLADAESDYRHDVLGDGGKALGVYQIWPLTWKGFVKDYGLKYQDRSNPVDQTIATIAALKDGKKCLWSPYKCK